ncbi:MAG: alpha/beta hydrolase [Actinomycetota bacterium]|nr:alpha/beta hydrolase [Actinomycetota bacterium]
MSSVVNVARLWLLVSLAIARRIFKRLLLGPTLPLWTWRTDIAVAVARTAIGFAATVPDDPIINQFGLRIKARVPVDLKRSVRVSTTSLGGLEADRYIRLGATKDAAIILYFHGGGYVFGNPGTHRQHVARLVHATGTTAIAPRYRLAPKHKYPAALDDAANAYRALIASGISPSEIVVSGDSAGGGLALAMLLRLRDAGEDMPSGAILFSPYADLEHTAYTIEANANTDYLPASELSVPNTTYANPSQLRDPYVSPVYASLTGLPPMLIFAGGAEMILDDSVRLKANAERDGVDMTLSIEPEMMHVWQALVPWEPAAARSLETATEWISDHA